MTQRLIGQNLILVLSPNFFADNETFIFEVLNDPLDRSLCDSNLQCDFSKYAVSLRMKDN